MIIGDVKQRMTIIEGNNLYIAQEFAGIARTVLQSSPEIYFAVTAVLADKASKSLKDIDPDSVKYCLSRVNKFITENEKGGVWND